MEKLINSGIVAVTRHNPSALDSYDKRIMDAVANHLQCPVDDIEFNRYDIYNGEPESTEKDEVYVNSSKGVFKLTWNRNDAAFDKVEELAEWPEWIRHNDAMTEYEDDFEES